MRLRSVSCLPTQFKLSKNTRAPVAQQHETHCHIFSLYFILLDRLQAGSQVGLVDSVGVKGNDVTVAVRHGGSLDGDLIGILSLLAGNYRERQAQILAALSCCLTQT